MKFLVFVLALFSVGAATLSNADPVITPNIGFNSVSVENSVSDFELGGTGSISLSPHISAIGGAWYGIGQTYLRGTVGARITATDVDDENFSIGIGGQYNATSDTKLRPQGWDADASVGWRPYPVKMPAVQLIAQGAFFPGQDEAAYMMFGIRYALKPY